MNIAFKCLLFEECLTTLQLVLFLCTGKFLRQKKMHKGVLILQPYCFTAFKNNSHLSVMLKHPYLSSKNEIRPSKGLIRWLIRKLYN